jgi:hypothetical protein
MNCDTLAQYSALNLFSVLSLVFTICFLETDLLQSHCNFKYNCNYSTCKVYNSHQVILAQSNSFLAAISDCQLPAL